MYLYKEMYWDPSLGLCECFIMALLLKSGLELEESASIQGPGKALLKFRPLHKEKIC